MPTSPTMVTDMRGRLCLLASRDRRDRSLKLWRDVCVYAALLDASETIDCPISGGHKAYVYVVRGALRVNGILLQIGEDASVIDETSITLNDGQDAEILLFDLA